MTDFFRNYKPIIISVVVILLIVVGIVVYLSTKNKIEIIPSKELIDNYLIYENELKQQRQQNQFGAEGEGEGGENNVLRTILASNPNDMRQTGSENKEPTFETLPRIEIKKKQTGLVRVSTHTFSRPSVISKCSIRVIGNRHGDKLFYAVVIRINNLVAGLYSGSSQVIDKQIDLNGPAIYIAPKEVVEFWYSENTNQIKDAGSLAFTSISDNEGKLEGEKRGSFCEKQSIVYQLSESDNSVMLCDHGTGNTKYVYIQFYTMS